MFGVYIADKDPITQKLMEIFVTSENRYRVVPWVNSAENPVDVILMDMTAALCPGRWNDVENLKKQNSKIKIILMTDLPEYSYIAQAKNMGADSFWYKETSAEALRQIMDRTVAGESVYPDSMPVIRLGNALSTEFTQRELEVLKEVVGGKTDVAIAENLKLSVSTVKFHIQKIREKTGFTNRTELAVRARECGLVIYPYREDQ